MSNQLLSDKRHKTTTQNEKQQESKSNEENHVRSIIDKIDEKKDIHVILFLFLSIKGFILVKLFDITG